MNAKSEFLKHTSGRALKCATFYLAHRYDEAAITFLLPVCFSEAQLKKFLRALNFEYDSGYGGQVLFGTIWYQDGTWSTRGEYDGAEWWELHEIPPIPDELT